MTKGVAKILKGKDTVDGAGVRLKRIFGYGSNSGFDPFLLLDDFGSDRPEEFIPGFPMHPHRGLETVTLVLEGEVAHRDSLGNCGVIGPGEVQWMSAGSGIVHEEMPLASQGRLRGLQLWVNLPAASKMSPPKYRDIGKDAIPKVAMPNGGEVLVIAGSYEGVTGPVKDVVASPTYLDVRLNPISIFTWDGIAGMTVFAYFVDGRAYCSPIQDEPVVSGEAVLFGNGSSIEIRTGGQGARFILVAGRPLKEPVAWRGPIVMNTIDELDLAFEELQKGTFIK